uniref:Disease resistance protein RGA1 n=2 Tax=Elaeis guineensis var. tenera TaxID=51953 RepID=A0A6I9R5C8_ELAGV|nr:putative disease resistance protein RGA1 [Elaeis guineensis]
MRKMRNLRHLCVVGCLGLIPMQPKMGQLSNFCRLSMFAVRQGDGSSMVELQNLNPTGNSLEISDLHEVKDPKEAMQAKLEAKTNLQSWTLSWNGHSDWARTSSSTKMAEDVFERLQPHPNLKELTMVGYMGIRLPTWMARAEQVSTLFSNLVELRLWDLKWCEHLPPLSQFPSLKRLFVSGMHALRKIEEDGGNVSSLEEFRLKDMPELEEWHVKPTTEMFPHLRLLDVHFCPKLMVQPCIPCSVENLMISRNQMLLSEGSIGGSSKLKILCIWSCGISSQSGWWGGLRYLTALEDLQISCCFALNCLPEVVMYMSSLRTLSLRNNRNLKSLEWGRMEPLFTALCNLEIGGSPRLTALPRWVGGLTSLQFLSLWFCDSLAMLPDLPALRGLRIEYCPLLARRCERGRGDDWPKIAHIPKISIFERERGEDREQTSKRSTFAAKFVSKLCYVSMLHWSKLRFQ